MLRTIIIALISAFILTGTAQTQTCVATWPYCLSNGTTADASQVMANFNAAAPLANPQFSGIVDLGPANGVRELVYGASGTNGYQMGFGVNLGQSANELSIFVGGASGVCCGAANFAIDSANQSTYPFTSYTTRFVVNSQNGNVGIGTVTPGYQLDVGSGTGYQYFRLNSGNSSYNGSAVLFENAGSLFSAIGNYSGIYGGAFNNALTLYTNSANVLIPNGNVGIGTVSPYATLDIRSGTNERLLVRAASGGGMSIGSVNDANSLFQPVEIDGSSIALMVGNVGIGTTSPGYPLTVSGIAYISSTAYATSFVPTSDRRLKDQISTLPSGALDLVEQLRPVSFVWKHPKDDSMNGQQIGFIAQEVEKVVPSMVITRHDPEKTKGLKYNEIVAILTKAVQEQQAEIKQLRSSHQADQVEIIKLKTDQQAQIDTLRSQIAQLTRAKVASLR
jgi:hypothetical protein